ncbi:MAG: metallopeptidase family protein [Candidatus Omnitrophota bacterium]
MEKRFLTTREFEALVRDAVKSLPREFKRKLENINIVILEEPSARQKKETGAGEDLLGLYEGVPLGERTHHDGSVLPDKITVFRGPLTRSCRSRREIRKAVRDTVLHEFAHYFGISDEHMIKDGTY